MWLDKNSPVSLETVRFLGVPFGFPKSKMIFRYMRKAAGTLQLQWRSMHPTDRWLPYFFDRFEGNPQEYTFYLVRTGEEPISRD